MAGERDRLARDLHDAVTQTIFSASLIAASLPARLPELTPAARTDVEMLQMLTKGALAEMRTLLLELRPEHLAEVPAGNPADAAGAGIQRPHRRARDRERQLRSQLYPAVCRSRLPFTG